MNLDFKNLNSLFNGYQKIAIKDKKNEVNIPKIARIVPPPSPGPIYMGILANFINNAPIFLLFYKSKILISCWVGISLVNMIYCGFFSSAIYLAQELIVE